MSARQAGPLPAVAALLCLGTPVKADAPASPSPSPAPSAAASAAPAATDTLATIKPVGEDMRVKAEDIDSVMQDEKIFFLDVRELSEIEETGSYQGYVHIPMGQLEARMAELPKDRPILVA